MTIDEVYRECQSIDVLIGWQGPDLVEAKCAIAYISGANDLCIRGAIHADIVGVADGDDINIFGHPLSVFNGNCIDYDNWYFGTTIKSYTIMMYRGSEHIGDALLFEVNR